MAEKKTGDPKDGEPHVGGRRFVPVHGLYGVASVLPGPITPGPPKPEPEERWTLAPGHHVKPPEATDDGAVDGEAPTEPVDGHVRLAGGPAGEPGTEPDPP